MQELNMVLVIKGQSWVSAQLEATSRGFTVTNARHPQYGQVVLQATGTWQAASEWFNEPGEAPFVTGTLLHFSEMRSK